jgi:hypothetical protein
VCKRLAAETGCVQSCGLRKKKNLSRAAAADVSGEPCHGLPLMSADLQVRLPVMKKWKSRGRAQAGAQLDREGGEQKSRGAAPAGAQLDGEGGNRKAGGPRQRGRSWTGEGGEQKSRGAAPAGAQLEWRGGQQKSRGKKIQHGENGAYPFPMGWSSLGKRSLSSDTVGAHSALCGSPFPVPFFPFLPLAPDAEGCGSASCGAGIGFWNFLTLHRVDCSVLH